MVDETVNVKADDVEVNFSGRTPKITIQAIDF